ncbi:hypothetical protein BJX96DRAFT_140759 [Aspergillus floccosus]
MSKRTAQGPQGSKESDLFDFNMSSTPDDKPQRATAAQMANRKIKDVRRRRPNTSGAGASFGGPFNSLDPNTVSGTPGAPQPATNGFTFGQSQSFPGASSTPSQPGQNGSSPFAFGQASGSSSFNFGFGGSGAASNPFASMNTGGSAQSSDGGSFSGFKGNLFNVPATSSPAPAQQSLPSGGLFGAGQQQNNTSGGLFGSTSTPSTQPASAAPTAGGIFGQPSGSTTPSTNIFGQSTTNKPTAFGQSTAFGESMQTSPDSKQSKPPIFGAGTTSGFGASSNIASPGTGSLFGTPTSKPADTPVKPLFGAKPAEQSTPSTSLFSATTQPSSAATPAPSTTPAAASTTPAPSTSLFGAPTPSAASPAAPFQNLFGTPAQSTTPKPAEREEKKPEEAQPKPAFQFGSSSGGVTPSLFSKSETAAAPSAPAGGLFQPPSTGSLFAPKPAATAEQNKPASSEGNPFASLFAPKPATPSKPTTEQKQLPSPAPFSGLFTPKPSDEAKKSESAKSTTPAPLFSAPTTTTTTTTTTSTPTAPSLFGQPSPAFSTSTTDKTQAPASPVPPPAPSPLKVNGLTSTSKPLTTTENAADSLSKATPSKLPADLDKKEKNDVELLHRMRILNESFQRELSRLNPATDDFDRLIEFYTRVRETIGAPVCGKRKSRDDEGKPTAEPASKKTKPFGLPSDTASAAKGSTPSTPKLSGASTPTAATKRKSTEDDSSAASAEKRVNGDSTTASIFAQSFSKSKSSESGPELTTASPAKPSTPETSRPALFSTTPTTSPAKPLFSAPATTQEASGSKPLFSTTPKPASAAPSTGSTPANPFVLKPTSGQSSTSAAPPPGLPKFGSGTTDFFAQFKQQAAKDAEKEKAKRKAEDFDSEEEDEAEWERRDAEEREKKLKELQSQSVKRSKFVPGKGFVFEDEASGATEKKEDKAAPATSLSGASVFDKKSASPANPNNIFGHLSATPSEAEEDDADDTEEASDGDEGDATKESSFGATSEDDSARDAETSEAESKAVSGSVAEFSANESGDDGDLTKAIQNSKKATEAASGGRSLFDRVQYDQDGKPKRQNEEEPKNPFSGLFNNTKFSSSVNSTSSTPNPFTFGKPQSEQGDASVSKPATPNIFGAAKPAGSLFGSPTPSASGASTPSIFAASQGTPKAPGTDNTWKPNSPIKFADSTVTPASNGDSGAADAPKPFSTLFGGDGAADSKASTGSGTPSLGFSFGGPSQRSPFLAPSNVSSATPSRASTPGVTSDTGAEESGDGDAVEKLPQVDLARSRAGEENEDVVMETRARGLKFVDKSWESQGVGFLRVLKDRTTSRGRVILRADPSGNVVLNTALMKAIEYKVSGNNVQFLVPKAEGPPEQWALRVKKEDVERLGTAMQETKT